MSATVGQGFILGYGTLLLYQSVGFRSAAYHRGLCWVRNPAIPCYTPIDALW